MESTVEPETKRAELGQLVPELPVADVEAAQAYYRDKLGFTVAWLYEDKSIGAVSRDNHAIFLRKREGVIEPSIHWVHAADVHAAYEEFTNLGATIVEPLEKKPWGLTQFTIQDLDGNLFYVHCD